MKIDKRTEKRYVFGKDLAKILRKHFNFDETTIVKASISCDAEDVTNIKVEFVI